MKFLGNIIDDKDLVNKGYIDQEITDVLKKTCHSAISKTYSELTNLKNANQLKPGQTYRLTDYFCKSVQPNTQCENHRFDIIMVAVAPNEFSDQCLAARNSEDGGYFSSSNLDAWQIWYNFGNNTTQYAWADPTNGRGVIYRMIDEQGNDCPYDFKNIKFQGQDGRESKFFYTFTLGTDDSFNTFTDFSLNSRCDNNIIKPYYSAEGAPAGQLRQRLNRCYFLNQQKSSNIDCYANQLDINCFNCRFAGHNINNKLDAGCNNIYIGWDSLNNHLGINCSGISLSNTCNSNVIGDYCSNIILNHYSWKNTYENNCSDIKITNENDVVLEYCQNNYFEPGSHNIRLKLPNGYGVHANHSVRNFHVSASVSGSSIFINDKMSIANNSKVIINISKNSKGQIIKFCNADSFTSLISEGTGNAIADIKEENGVVTVTKKDFLLTEGGEMKGKVHFNDWEYTSGNQARFTVNNPGSNWFGFGNSGADAKLGLVDSNYNWVDGSKTPQSLLLDFKSVKSSTSITAPSFIGNLTGTSTKAINDSDNNPINTTYTKKKQAIPYIVGPSSDTVGLWTGTYTGLIYEDGLTIIYVPGVSGTSSNGGTTLNINGLGAKPCYYSNTSRMTTHYSVGTPIILTYINGSWKRADYNTDSGNYNLRNNKTYKCATALKAYNPIGENLNGELVDIITTPFNPFSNFYLCSLTRTAGQTGDWLNLYRNHYGHPLRYGSSYVATTIYKPVYMKGTISDGLFTFNSFTQDLPTTDDNTYVYYYIGEITSASSYVSYSDVHPIFVRRNGELKLYSGYTEESSHATSATQLQNARTLWGQSFNGTANVTGLIKADDGVQIGNTTDIGWYKNESRITAGNGTARGVNVGSLLISNLWADSNKVPTNGAYIKGYINSSSGGNEKNNSNPTYVWGTNGRDNYLRTYNTDYLQVYESRLQWGGKSFYGYSPLDASMVGELGANRLAFARANGITIEYSDDGTTWKDYGASDEQKGALTSSGYAFYVGKCNSRPKGQQQATSNDKLRITINTSSAEIYTVLHKVILYISTSGSENCTCTIQKALQATPDDYVDVITKQPIAGWSGWNVINFDAFITYGTTPSTQYGRIRFIFEQTGNPSGNYTGLCIRKLFAFGGMGWVTPSNLAATGHLYSYDGNQNAFFPKDIHATKLFTTDIQTTSGHINGTLSFTSNKVAINFRPDSYAYYSKIEYMTAGNEALVFANKQPVTSFIFKCGKDLTTTSDWESEVPIPTMQMKNQSLYINELISNGAVPTYNFKVNGNFYLGSTNIKNNIIQSSSNSNNANSYALKIIQGTDNGSNSYDSVIISSNDSSTLRLSEAAGAQLGFSATDNKSVITSTHDLKIYVGSIKNGIIYTGASGNQAMEITSTGNIGIGTSTPTSKLHVAGNTIVTGNISAGGKISLDGQEKLIYLSTLSDVKLPGNSSLGNGDLLTWDPNTDGGRWINIPRSSIVPEIPDFSSINYTAGPLNIQNNNSNNVVLCAGGGKVGIGNAAPSYKLDIVGSVHATAGFFDSSDERLKNFKEDISVDFNKLKQIPKKYFSWKEDETNKLNIGTSAQEVQKIYPEVVSTDNDGILSVDYAKLSIIALKAIDQLHNENEQLKTELKNIKDILNKLI